MKIALFSSLFLTTLLFFTLSSSAGEIVKWVDENGKVHFSDREPTNKSIKVEKLEAVEAPKQGMTPEELSEQKKRTIEYKIKLDKERKKRKNQDNSVKTVAKEEKEAEKEISSKLEYCRNTFKNIKKRTACFRDAKK